MKLILVHGINNQGKSSQVIIDEWLGGLESALSSTEMDQLRRAQIVAPYYGDVLHDATEKSSQAGPAPVAQSLGEVSGDEAAFYLAAFNDIAAAAGVTEEQIRAQMPATGVTAQGLPFDRRLLAVVRAVEHVSPFHGEVALRFVPQAFVYLNRAATTRAIDDIVRPALDGEPCVVLAHSLGTVVTYKLLRANPALRVSQYFTLGSPLALAAVKNALGPAFRRPDSVAHWLNGLDPNDAVTLGRALTPSTFGTGIDNIGDIANSHEDPHSIFDYLRDTRVAHALSTALFP